MFIKKIFLVDLLFLFVLFRIGKVLWRDIGRGWLWFLKCKWVIFKYIVLFLMYRVNVKFYLILGFLVFLKSLNCIFFMWFNFIFYFVLY